jgi:hypothetical protein
VSNPNHACFLKKTLYGLKQEPQAWFPCFSSFIQTIGFVPALSDTSPFVFHDNSRNSYLLLYVDDTILTASPTSFLQHIISLLRAEFSMADLCVLHHFLGMDILRDDSGLSFSTTIYS